VAAAEEDSYDEDCSRPNPEEKAAEKRAILASFGTL
jgi:hypothetical protein